MKIIVSCHCDTCFRQPFMRWKDGILRGALDNFASMLATSLLILSVRDVIVEWTEDEELTMDGARYLAKAHDPQGTLFIVMDVTSQAKGNKFTIENIHRIEIKHIRKALIPLKGQYRIIMNGTESEAWLYKDRGFPVIEVDIPVKGGNHSLDSTTTFENILTVAKAIELIVQYFKDKTLSEVEQT